MADAQEAKVAAKKKAEEQARKDALVQPKDPEWKGVEPGSEPPLHLLNTRAKREREEKRNLIRDTAKAAAATVTKTLQRGGVKVRRATPTEPVGPNTAAAMADTSES